MLKSRTAALLVGASALAMLSSAAVAQEAAASADLEAIVVTGSRLATAGFNAPTPVTVVGAAAIERASPATLGESLQELPVFRNGVGPTSVTNGVVAANQASMDLRALGSARTLTLVNGRRIVPVNATGTFDTNLLPSTLIESVDVVTGGASAAYGSDAVAGVVNFNLRNDLEGFRGQIRYGITERGDNEEPSLALAWGSSFAGGKGHIILGGELNKASGVNTMFDRDWGRREPGELALGNTRASNLPNTIVGEWVELYLYQPGGFVSAGPLTGTAFNANGQPFIPTLSPIRGNQEMISAGPGSVLYGNTEYSTMVLRGDYERSAFAGRIEYDITEDTKVFAEFNYGELYTFNNSGTCCKNQTFRINRDNPFLPADTVARMVATNTAQIQVNRRGEYAGLKSGNETRMRNMVFGVEGSVFGDWDWDAYFQNGHTYQFTSLTNTPRTADMHAAAYVVRNPVTGALECGPTATNPFFLAVTDLELRRRQMASVSPGCVPYNAIGVNAESNAAAVRYFMGSSDQDNWIDRSVAAVNLRGSPFELPAGPVALAVGAEWREDKVEARGCPDCLADKLINQNYKSYSGEVNVKEAFAEIGVPVIREQPFFQALDLNGAIRRTDYSLSGGVTTWKVGATWDPNSMFRFRATRSRDIRAPNLSELYNPGGSGRANVTNRRTGASGIVDSTTAGNPTLVPEIADTFTGGVVFQPEWDWAWGLRMSVDYYDIAVKGVISSVGAQDTLDRFLAGQTQYAPFIFFDTNVPFGIARVNGIQENQNQRIIRGIDFEASARAPIDAIGLPGALSMRGLVTYAMENLTITRDGISSDEAGIAAPYLQGNFSFNYDLNRFSAGLTALYKSSIRRSNTLIGPDSPLYNAVIVPGTETGPCGRLLVNNVATGNCTKNTTINQNVFPSSVQFNLSMSYDIIASPGRRLQAFGYVENLLDTDPDVVSVSILGSSPYNTVGRNYRVGLRFEF